MNVRMPSARFVSRALNPQNSCYYLKGNIHISSYMVQWLDSAKLLNTYANIRNVLEMSAQNNNSNHAFTAKSIITKAWLQTCVRFLISSVFLKGMTGSQRETVAESPYQRQDIRTDTIIQSGIFLLDFLVQISHIDCS